MNAMIELGYLVSSVSFLGGLKFMSYPSKAKTGNLLAATGMLFAVFLTFYAGFSDAVPTTNLIIILGAILLGTLVGFRLSSKVEMTAMPQLVSLFNATGGGCAVLLGLVEGYYLSENIASMGLQISLIVGILTGGIAFTGSIVAKQKLAGKMKDQNQKTLVYFSRLFLVVLLLLPILFLSGILPVTFTVFVYIMAAVSLLYGFLFVLPIGGADMPVVISLLNSITGIATAFAGFVYGNKVMIAGGIFVGAAGLLLTVLMCKAMNRSLLKVLAGKMKGSKGSTSEAEQEIQETSVSEIALQLSFAQKVAIVPGYGLAVAQAQHVCSQLENLLENRDTEVHYIIHPVAGRMPGHMNVLLAEANVDYAHLKEMDEVNDVMAQYDMTLIIGANDVVNPAAETDEDSAVFGMPIIKAHHSKKVVVMKRSMSAGYSGATNKLFEMENCNLLFGDAKEMLQKITNELKLI